MQTDLKEPLWRERLGSLWKDGRQAWSGEVCATEKDAATLRGSALLTVLHTCQCLPREKFHVFEYGLIVIINIIH